MTIEDRLDHIYKSLFYQKSHWGFFLSLSDYWEYVSKIPELKKISEDLISERDIEYKKVDGYEQKALRELEESKNCILKIANERKIKSKDLGRAIKKLKGHEDGSAVMATGDGFQSDNLEYLLFEVAHLIPQDIRMEALKEFIDDNKIPQNIYGNFTFSKTYSKRVELWNRLKELKKVKMWGVLEAILNVSEALELLLESKHDRFKFRRTSDNFYEKKRLTQVEFAIEDFKKIKPKEPPQRQAINNLHYLDLFKFQNYATRLHHYFLQNIPADSKLTRNKHYQRQVLEEKFKIYIKDREIWINNYLIAKPHAVGNNLEFFQYIRSKHPHTLVERNKMPSVGDGINFGYVKEMIKNKSFIKILNQLGFKGEILKAFFYKRSKDSLIYRGDEITIKDLENSGIKKALFLKELELAHTKNNPE